VQINIAAEGPGLKLSSYWHTQNPRGTPQLLADERGVLPTGSWPSSTR
ncbi:hypothetical protein FOPG_18319, partial [Fusarium oxysporum f. sp. conglutinans race 2 54008]